MNLLKTPSVKKIILHPSSHLLQQLERKRSGELFSEDKVSFVWLKCKIAVIKKIKSRGRFRVFYYIIKTPISVMYC